MLPARKRSDKYFNVLDNDLMEACMHLKLSTSTFCIFLAFMVSACGNTIEPGTQSANAKLTVKAAVAKVQMTTHPFVYTAVGSVTAATASTISSKLMGTVTAVNVHVGDSVARGKTLVTIDNRQVNARLHQARAALQEARQAMQAAISARETARSAEKLARTTYQRYQKLLDEDSVSKQEFDEINARYHEAASSLKRTEAMVQAASSRIHQARAELTVAQVRFRDAVVRAPYDAVITAKMVEPGDLATPGRPFLRLEQKGTFEVKLILPEGYIQQIHPKQKLRIHIPAMHTRAFTGVVKTISPTADPTTRTFFVKVVLPKNGPFKSGMFARVDIPVGESGLLTLPLSAVVRHGQLTGFYRVDARQIARFRLIRTGRTLGDVVEVISGLEKGDRYVISPPPKLADGVKVEIQS